MPEGSTVGSPGKAWAPKNEIGERSADWSPRCGSRSLLFCYREGFLGDIFTMDLGGQIYMFLFSHFYVQLNYRQASGCEDGFKELLPPEILMKLTSLRGGMGPEAISQYQLRHPLLEVCRYWRRNNIWNVRWQKLVCGLKTQTEDGGCGFDIHLTIMAVTTFVVL